MRRLIVELAAGWAGSSHLELGLVYFSYLSYDFPRPDITLRVTHFLRLYFIPGVHCAADEKTSHLDIYLGQ